MLETAKAKYETSIIFLLKGQFFCCILLVVIYILEPFANFSHLKLKLSENVRCKTHCVCVDQKRALCKSY